jgi:hypothetical protein
VYGVGYNLFFMEWSYIAAAAVNAKGAPSGASQAAVHVKNRKLQSLERYQHYYSTVESSLLSRRSSCLR